MTKFNREKVLRQLKFKRKWRSYSRYVYIAVPCVLCCLLCLYFAYSKFSISEEQAVIRTTVGDFIHGDVVIGAYIDGEYSSTIPGKNDGYAVEKVVCDNDAVGTWNVEKWGLLVNNLSKRTKCNVYFKKYLIADKIIELAQSDTVNFANDDPDGNIRYIGANPDNYVYFNCSDYTNQSDSTCEKWRIIGLFNNITKSDGTKENLVKIVKSESIGTIAWDENLSGGYWANATLQQNLNSGTYYTTTLKNDVTRSKIENVMWNLGASSTIIDVTAKMFYERERSVNTNNDEISAWTGKVGLIYASDYGYATSGGTTANRTTCLQTALNNWKNSDVSDCKDNNYLYKSSHVQWLLNLYGDARDLNVLNIDIRGKVSDTAKFTTSTSTKIKYEPLEPVVLPNNQNVNVYPSLYLKSNISISAGTGSSGDPYQLSIK